MTSHKTVEFKLYMILGIKICYILMFIINEDALNKKYLISYFIL